MPFVACVLGLLGGGCDVPSTPSKGQPSQIAAVSGTRWQAASPSFVVTSRHSDHDARKVAEFCERWRARLQAHWCGAVREGWSPRCQVIVHANRSTYLAAVGAGAAQTYGSSWIEFDRQKQPSRRQIDYRGDDPQGLAAVPHELTHVVLADLLQGRQPPRWADEGMAMLADPAAKQRLHHRDVLDGQTRRIAFRAVEILTLDNYPHPSRVPAFYGQSLSLTSFLAARDRPTTFVKFLQDSLDHGYDAALRKRYNIANVAELERLWQARPTRYSLTDL